MGDSPALALGEPIHVLADERARRARVYLGRLSDRYPTQLRPSDMSLSDLLVNGVNEGSSVAARAVEGEQDRLTVASAPRAFEDLFAVASSSSAPRAFEAVVPVREPYPNPAPRKSV